jgi:hypothetical protein
MNNLRKFATEADYTAATLNYPAVSWVVNGDTVHYDKEAPTPPTPSVADIKATYNITSTSSPTGIYYQHTGSGSGSGAGKVEGLVPSQMWVDGVEVTPTKEYVFSTTGEHIVEYKLAEGETSVPIKAFYNVSLNLVSVEINSEITAIGNNAFDNCSSLTSIVSNAMTAPALGSNTFSGISHNGVLTVPSGSQGYCETWMMGNGALASLGWTIEGVTCGGGSGSGSGS